jgi:hypothetical protein
MQEKYDGGTAFPTGIFTDDKGVIIGGGNGMSLRDYFAAKAMQTMLGWDNDHTNWDSYAEDSYMMADAMLKAREE